MLPLFAIAFPSNALYFYTILNNVVNYDLIPADDLYKKYMYFNDENNLPFNDYFDFMGISTVNFVSNIGS